MDMSSGDMFDHYTASTAPSSRKKDSKRLRGESSKAASKKARTKDHPPAATPLKEKMPPPSPHDQQSPPAPVNQHSTPPAPTEQTPQGNQPGDALTSTVVGLARERIYKLSKHKRSQEAIVGTNSMEGLLTITVGWRRTGALLTQTRNADTKYIEAMKVLGGKNVDMLERNTELLDKNTEMLEKNSKLAKELQQFKTALDKANEDKEKFKECARLNCQEAKQLKVDLIASRKETEELEGRVKELEEMNARNLKKNYVVSLLWLKNKEKKEKSGKFQRNWRF
ncbi:uncharacterized protein LOC133779847 [Humulus lupulus]|uniref:uncharacterized protein LOC133779847 n=1 Tax=Humulus lupulus TaxID=3486 RepID=UPI002B40348C|nr:uncharacterized protein LOC133779847 [Humulus lupulus]